jgi:arabinofuranosyltransferase
VGLVVFLALVHADAWSFVCDDAFISFRYARNLAEHGELAFNVDPLERVEGYTNFLWVAVLAIGARLGLAPEVLSIVLGRAAMAAGVVLAMVLAGRLRRGEPARIGDPIAPLLTAALLCASPEWVVWGNGGLETAFAAAWVLGAILAFTDDRPLVAAVCAAAAVLTRPDGAIPLAAWVLGWALGLDADGRRHALARWGWYALALVVLAVPLVGHLAWRKSYYGEWLPNTWAVKTHGARLRGTWGVTYVQAWVMSTGLVALAPLVLALRRRHAPAVLAIAASVAYGWWVGGDFMAYSRYYVVATALLAVLAGVLVGDSIAWLEHHRAAGVRHWIPPLALAVAAAAPAATLVHALERRAIDRAKPEGWLDGRWEGVTAMDRFAKVGLAAGEWMREQLPEGTLITVGAAGAVPYASELPTIDGFGLVDPVIAKMEDPPLVDDRRARPGHQLVAPPDYIRSRDPDLVCHAGYRGAARPGERDARAPFRDGYVWACIEPESFVDRWSEGGVLDPGVYCCRRPRDRVVGPFGR